jgi:hypothetical protein
MLRWGVDGEELLLTFRKASKQGASSDECEAFRAVLRENGIEPDHISPSPCAMVPKWLRDRGGAADTMHVMSRQFRTT